MATTREDIKRWIERGQRKGATHTIVVCDTFDHGDYPVYVYGGSEEARAKHKEYFDGKHEMQRVMEVYNLSGDLDAQLAAPRAFEFETPVPATNRFTVVTDDAVEVALAELATLRARVTQLETEGMFLRSVLEETRLGTDSGDGLPCWCPSPTYAGRRPSAGPQHSLRCLTCRAALGYAGTAGDEGVAVE